MKVTIVFESMYGNTHEIADQIAAGFGESFDVVVTPVAGAEASDVGAGLLVVGGPTHVHGLSSTRSRMAAAEAADKELDLHLDHEVLEPGLRDWLDDIPDGDARRAVAFDTRADASPLLTGRASKGISRRLQRRGYDVIASPQSFLVDKKNHLIEGEAARAEAWGAQLAELLSSTVGSLMSTD